MTVVYLINCLPTSSFKFYNPHASLFIEDLSHDHLWVFCSLCFPCLRPFRVIKLDFKSTHCNFLSYNSCHNGYKCYDHVSSRNYIPRHVIFYESIFPSPLLTPQPTLYFLPLLLLPTSLSCVIFHTIVLSLPLLSSFPYSLLSSSKLFNLWSLQLHIQCFWRCTSHHSKHTLRSPSITLTTRSLPGCTINLITITFMSSLDC